MKKKTTGNGDSAKAAPVQVNTPDEQQVDCALAEIIYVLNGYTPQHGFTALLTALTTWIVENDLDPRWVIGVLIRGVELGLKAKAAEESKEQLV